MAESSVGAAFLSASLEVLFDRLTSPEVLSFIQGPILTDQLLNKLKRKLIIIHSVFNDAEVKQFTNPSIKEWLDQVKDSLYDAEDLLDEIATDALCCKMAVAESQTSPTKIWNSFSAWIKAPFANQRIESRIKEMIFKLEDISEEIHTLGLKEGEAKKLPSRQPSTCLIDDSCVYGRDEIKEDIITKQLLADNSRGNQIEVISIVGMGGSGKTTLTQLLYNDKRVKQHFELKAWVCVSTEFLLVRITKLILEGIGNASTSDNLSLLQLQLKESLGNKKLLLVLDDVWDNIRYLDWDGLQTPLLAAAQGSKIVVTTRSENVARIMHAANTHHLGKLCPEDCWSLFAKLAFENRDPTAYPQLETTGRKIVDKCQGLPLAVKALGSLLHSEAEKREWDDILNSEIWDLHPNDEILPSLRLSYHHLPLHLKRCFAYCSIFPKDHEFDKDKLILLWMAEGLLQLPKSKKRMEEVGDLYFNELVAKSFFQKSVTKESYFVMHDLMHDLGQHICGEFCVRLEYDKMQEVSDKARHYVDFKNDSGGMPAFKKIEAITRVKNLRSFLELKPFMYASYYTLSHRLSQDIFQKIRCLRVLSVHQYQITDLPDSICNLKHLRYLDLSCTMIKKLPESVCDLYNLQTMIFSNCCCLTKLPSRMGKLISLRYLDIGNADALREMPSDIGQLKSLQKLIRFIVGQKSGLRIGELKELSDIRGTLRISKMDNVVCAKDALWANMKDKRYLDKLVFEWDYGTGDGILQNGTTNNILSKLQPHPNLKELVLMNYPGVIFPDWVGDPSFLNLVSLELSNCEYCSSLPPLGQLPSLKHVDISGMNGVERVGSEFYGNGFSSTKPSFPSLKSLKFQFMHNWEKWLCCECRFGEFPHLQELYLQFCPKLTGELPKKLGSLKKLVIDGCPNLLMASLAIPAISKLKLRNYGKLQLKRPAYGFLSLESSDIEISTLSQWKQLPIGPHQLTITTGDSVESLLEEGIPQTDTCFLEDLTIRDCCFLSSLHRVSLPTTLKSLQISKCKNLEFLLPELFKCHHPFLQHLSILGGTCYSLSLSFSLIIFPRLMHLQIDELKGLEYLSASISQECPTSLDDLKIERCPDLVYIEMPALNCVISKCLKLKLVKHTYLFMQRLSLEDCPGLLFQRDGLPSKLHQLTIKNCRQLTPRVDWGLRKLASLTKFRIIGGCEEMESFAEDCLLPSMITSLEIEDLPNLKSLNNLQHLCSLEQLCISECPELLSLTGSGLEHLTFLKLLVIRDCSRLQFLTEAVAFQNLSSLEELQIFDCPKLQYLTKRRLPESISCLTIKNCPLLEERCRFEKGQDWHYIAHISRIVINYEILK